MIDVHETSALSLYYVQVAGTTAYWPELIMILVWCLIFWASWWSFPHKPCAWIPTPGSTYVLYISWGAFNTMALSSQCAILHPNAMICFDPPLKYRTPPQYPGGFNLWLTLVHFGSSAKG